MAKKRVRVAVILLLGVLGGATGCGSAGGTGIPGDGRPVVLTTFTVLADMARSVGGDRLRVESITKPGAEIHGYEPTPDDLRRTRGAGLILDNGLGLEAWFARFVERAEVRHVVVSEGVTPIPIGEDAYQGKANPHAWMSPLNAKIYVDNMAKAFGELDPGGAETFRANATAYKVKLEQLHRDLVTKTSVLPPQQRALVTCEGAFSYLARDAGLTERYLWAVNAEQQATPQQVSRTVQFVRDNKVTAVFCESTVSGDVQKRVAIEAGTKFGGVLYVDSLSEPDGPVPTYLDLLRHDVDTIVKGLTG